MKIRNIDLGERPVVLAPMEDVTDLGFRLMCKEFGAAMVYSEFASADALVRLVNKTMQKLAISPDERPVAIQIYGKEVEPMVEAARIVGEQAHPDVLDLNFGCPVKRVAGKGAGAGMLQNVPQMLAITRAMVDAVDTLTTEKAIKMFEKFKIFTRAELYSRAEILYEIYSKTINIEARTMIDMASKQIMPTVMKYTRQLADTVLAVQRAGASPRAQEKLLTEVSDLLEKAQDALEKLKDDEAKAAQLSDEKEKAFFYKDTIKADMEALREPVDELEMLVDKEMWPYPTYADMLFEL